MDNLNFSCLGEILNNDFNKLTKIKSNIAGYPENQKFNYNGILKFMKLSLNNIGDSFSESNYPLNTLKYEAEVIDYMANLYHKYSDYWGYITSGGTEGNLFAIHLALCKYPDAQLLFSEHSHYSVIKSARITRSRYVAVASQKNGEIDYTDFETKIKAFSNKPLIIILNLGTTMTGAIDNIKKIKKIIADHSIKEYYLHCDAALHGFFLPFTEIADCLLLDDIDSISISGHKFIGSPLPCGIFLTHSKLFENNKENIEYIKSYDCTLLGSRNGIAALILWSAIRQKSKAQFKNLTQNCLLLTEYAVNKMLEYGIPAWANPYSPVVVFPRPSEETIKKWSIAPYQDMAHIITLPHLTKKKIDCIIIDIISDLKKNN